MEQQGVEYLSEGQFLVVEDGSEGGAFCSIFGLTGLKRLMIFALTLLRIEKGNPLLVIMLTLVGHSFFFCCSVF